MTALAQNSTSYSHPTGNPTRRGGSLVLRNTHIFVGALCAFHDDYVAASSRLMPATDYDNANTPAQGGPLQIAGADTNAGLRAFSKVPGIKFAIVTAGTVPIVSVSTPTGSTAPLITVTCANTTTASDIVQAVNGNAWARELMVIYRTGNGATVAGQQAAAYLPYIRLAGWAKKEFDASIAAYASTDMPVTEIIELDTGIGFMAADATDPVTVSDVGGMVSVLDDQTLQHGPHPLCLKAFLFDWLPAHAGAQGPCIRVQ